MAMMLCVVSQGMCECRESVVDYSAADAFEGRNVEVNVNANVNVKKASYVRIGDGDEAVLVREIVTDAEVRRFLKMFLEVTADCSVGEMEAKGEEMKEKGYGDKLVRKSVAILKN